MTPVTARAASQLQTILFKAISEFISHLLPTLTGLKEKELDLFSLFFVQGIKVSCCLREPEHTFTTVRQSTRISTVTIRPWIFPHKAKEMQRANRQQMRDDAPEEQLAAQLLQ